MNEHTYCPHCGQHLDSASGVPEATGLEVGAALAAVCVAYGAAFALFAGLVSGSPAIVFVAAAVLVSTVAGAIHRMQRDQIELMEYLSSDESERVLSEEEQPLPHIPLW